MRSTGFTPCGNKVIIPQSSVVDLTEKQFLVGKRPVLLSEVATGHWLSQELQGRRLHALALAMSDHQHPWKWKAGHGLKEDWQSFRGRKALEARGDARCSVWSRSPVCTPASHA